MVYNIVELPDDIICHIFSFLSIRDTFRAKASSPKWLHLPDSGPVIKFVAEDLFGKKNLSSEDERSPALRSKFVKIVNDSMNNWTGKTIHTLQINVCLVEEEHYRHMERWITEAVRLKVEELDIRLSNFSLSRRYTFPYTLIQNDAPYLKRLRLSCCNLSSFDFGWLSNLIALELSFVTLDHTIMDLILSNGTNLVSLELDCRLPEYVWTDGQLFRLKKLKIGGTFLELNLNCPSLEEFEYQGSVNSMGFVHVPALREAKLLSWGAFNYCSLLFSNVPIQARSLQALSLSIGTDEIIPFPRYLARFSLKKLRIEVWGRFDLGSISNLINACPCLETLQIRMLCGDQNDTTRKGKYRGKSHYRLKRVEFVRFFENWNAMGLAKHVLRNAVALEEMVIITSCHKTEEFECLQQLKKEVNPTAQVIISKYPSAGTRLTQNF